MKIILLSILAVLFILGSGTSTARGRKAPPPVFLGGNIGSWLGNGGGGPLFGFDFPWGKDFPFGGGSMSDPGFHGYMEWGDWNPPGGSGGHGSPHGDSTFGCRNVCQEATFTGGCRDLCYCRKFTHDDNATICDKNWVPGLSDGRTCYIYTGGCPGDPE